MKHGCLILFLVVASLACSQEAGTFQSPQPHAVQRYEAGWNKNPFTLKTAPQVVESVSFAKDLAIGTYYGDSADPTIIIVNTKTNERLRLKQDQPAANGMKLRSVKLSSSRKDLVVEVTLGTETAAIRYDDNYVKQLAAAEMNKEPATQQQTRQPSGAPSKILIPQTPSQPVKGPTSVTHPATAQTVPVAPGQPGSAHPPVTHQPPTAVAPEGAEPVVSLATSLNAAPTVPARRRMTVPLVNAPPNSQ